MTYPDMARAMRPARVAWAAICLLAMTGMAGCLAPFSGHEAPPGWNRDATTGVQWRPMASVELETLGHPADARGWFTRDHGGLEGFKTDDEVDISFALEDQVVTLRFVLDSTSTTQSGLAGPGGTTWQEEEDRRYKVPDAPEWRAMMAGDQFLATRHTEDGAKAWANGPHPRLDLTGDYLRVALLTCEQWVSENDDCKP